jgi:anti-sigma regulatory factor (Ser/Thr protein kinase)
VVTFDAGNPAPHHAGYVHDLLLYRSDDELRDVVVPFVRDAADAGEPVLVRDGTPVAALVRSTLGAAVPVTYFDGEGGHPAASIVRMLALARHAIDTGAPAVRVLGQVPHLGADGNPWAQWAAYEAVANHALAALPMWSLCAYDRRAFSAELVDAATLTHPAFSGGAGGREVNDRYTQPTAFLDGIPQPIADPLESAPPDVELTDVHAPQPVRAAVARVGHGLLAPQALADLGIAVSEVTANGLLYGRPPVVARLWRRPDRLLVTVADGGAGPAGMRRGWLPPLDQRSEGGYGLWISRQCCDELDIRVDFSGCTVGLVTWADRRRGSRPGPASDGSPATG